MTAMPDMMSMPRSPEAERALLGYVLREATANDDAVAFFEATTIVRANDFHSYAHQELWGVLVKMAEAGVKIDPVTVNHQIGKAKLADDISDRLIVELFDAAPGAMEVSNYARIIRQKADLRRYLAASRLIADRAMVPGADPSEVGAAAGAALHAIQDQATSRSRPIADSIMLAMEEWTRRQNVPAGEMCGVGTPWPKLNMMTGGLQAGELSVLAARPSVGKTLVALNLIAHVCDRGGVVQFASLEQKDEELINRWIACRASINGMKFRDCKFTRDEERKIAEATHHMSQTWKLETTESGSQTVSSIVADIRKRKRQAGVLDLVVIDYLGLIENDTPVKEIRIYLGDMCRRLKLAAKDIGCHIVLLCQLNRNKEHRGKESEPELSDLRDSGNIEEHADMVMMLHKPVEDENLDEEKVEFFIRKQRNGRKGKITCLHAKKYFEVREIASELSGRYGAA